jgi:glycosyltransferase involved in cell wall biosynthesis
MLSAIVNMSEFHIIAPFHISGGGNWAAIDIYYELRGSNHVRLWSPQHPGTWFRDYADINEIRPYSGQFPNKGTLIICGVRTELGPWFDQVRFERVVMIHDEFTPLPLYKSLNRIARSRNSKVEIHYVSNFSRTTAGLDGMVRYPVPHPERLKLNATDNGHQTRNETFTVGRLSRDTINKHNYRDPGIYRNLISQGFKLRLAGATCIKPWLADLQSGIELLPELPQSEVAGFLGSLDCFFYRTSLGLKEAFGLVVIEAMLAGIPVVCHRQGGYAEVIQHGENGFLFNHDAEALMILKQLKANPVFAKEVGKKARESVLAGF